jgi:hypothetical protein
MLFQGMKPELTPEERSLPISRYYDVPMYLPGPLEQQILARPLDPATVTKAEQFTSLLRLEGYTGSDYGYCMMPDGSGYLATYSEFRNCTFEMLDWWFPWMATHCKNQPAGVGNLRYKIWCPYGHFDHGRKKAPDGNVYMCAQEALDLGLEGDPADSIYMHDLDPRQFGVSPEQLAALDQAKASYGISYETFDYPGMHLCMHIMRQRDDGVIENIGREWIGYGVRDGKVVRDEATPVDEAFLKKIVLHCTTEMLRLDRILPEIYAEYHDKPADAD